MLEKLLQKYFGLTSDLTTQDGDYTEAGKKAYNRLVDCINMLGEVTDTINVEEIINDLSKQEYEE